MLAYLDLPSGISGDLFLGCLIDAGWSVDRLKEVIGKLGLPESEYTIRAGPVMKGPLRAMLADIQTSEGHVHRHLADIEGIINKADLPARVKADAVAVFTRLADAEAKVHGTTRDQIHFHEVGAMDAIIDIVGTCAGLHEMGIGTGPSGSLFVSPLPLAQGWTKSAHGQIPLPAPATLELLAAAGAPTRPAPGLGEWVTPTGAALVCTLARYAPHGPPAMKLARIGTGAGQKEAAWPNVARLWLGQPLGSAGGGHGDGGLVQLETNIDDMNPQFFAPVSEKLFAAGAKDVWFTPIQMKKNRPAVMLSALGPAASEQNLSRIILEETTTLGVRVHRVDHRYEADREMREVDTTWGKVQVKMKLLDDTGPAAAMPEFEDCRLLAEKHGVPVKRVYDEAMAAAHGLMKGA